jgi:hypothetical protein
LPKRTHLTATPNKTKRNHSIHNGGKQYRFDSALLLRKVTAVPVYCSASRSSSAPRVRPALPESPGR